MAPGDYSAIAHAVASVVKDTAAAGIRADLQLEPAEIGVMLAYWSMPAYLALLGGLILLARAIFVDRIGVGKDAEEVV